MGKQRRRELASASATRSIAATKVRFFASGAMHWLRRLLAQVTIAGVRVAAGLERSPMAPAKPTTEHAIITYADARAIRRTVLARLMIFERALIWRWCIGVAVAYAALFTALLAILVLATHASL
jgi:hypothetical protein